MGGKLHDALGLPIVDVCRLSQLRAKRSGTSDTCILCTGQMRPMYQKHSEAMGVYSISAWQIAGKHSVSLEVTTAINCTSRVGSYWACKFLITASRMPVVSMPCHFGEVELVNARVDLSQHFSQYGPTRK